MTFPWMKPGFRPIPRDTGDGGGGGDQTDPAADRISTLEARIGTLAQALGGMQQDTQQRTQQQQAEAERQRVLQAAQGFVDEAAHKLQTARAKLAAAHDTGDGAAIADAAAEMSTAAAEHTAARMHAESLRHQAQQPRPAQQPTQRPAQQAQPKVDDTNLRQWRDRNKSWYGIDAEMTRAAIDVAKEVESERVLEVGSEPYFQAIDARLRTRYSDRMPRSTAAQVQTQRGSMSAAAPNSQQRIPEAIANGYRRMGINVDDPEVAKQMVSARETAVRKGFLPDTPQYGSVVTR